MKGIDYMRLWHEELLPHLPRQQLLGQHRECAALRGAGWGRKHSVVNYVFTHLPNKLVAYHYRVMDEMERRGYHPDSIWRDPEWRGNKLGKCEDWASVEEFAGLVYAEHDDEYLQECLDNLKSKGIEIEITPIGD